MPALNPMESLAETGQRRAGVLRERPSAFLVSSAFAGAYIAIGVVLILLVGAKVAPDLRKIAMGASFGVALTLVVFAGADLFTGHNLYGTAAALRGGLRVRELAMVWTTCWLGNLVGAITIAWLVHAGNSELLDQSGLALLRSLAEHKSSSSPGPLFLRAVLCNWLVCLAIWMCARTTSDAAKCVLIWWCLFTFIVCGFEHSVANMAVFALAVQFDAVSLAPGQVLQSLFVVTMGNVVGGAGLVGLGYSIGGMPRAEASRDRVVDGASGPSR
jgi:nitrite transporter NirC